MVAQNTAMKGTLRNSDEKARGPGTGPGGNRKGRGKYEVTDTIRFY